MPPLLGAHMSIAGGVARAVDRAVAAGCETLQIFTKSSNQWAARALSPEEAAGFRERVREAGLASVMAHDSYLINPATSDDTLWEKSTAALVHEVERCALLGIPCLIMHPGAHVGAGEDSGIRRVARALDRVHGELPGAGVMILLENTAGAGTLLGRTFESLRGILDRVKHPEKLGVCFDTQHAFAAGYDLATRRGWEETWGRFERVIGWSRLKALHLNDSKKPRGSRVDRHEHIGLGLLGPGAFLRVMNDSRLDGLPASLETEKTEGGFEDEMNLAVLRRLAGRQSSPSLKAIHSWREAARRSIPPSAGEPVRK